MSISGTITFYQDYEGLDLRRRFQRLLRITCAEHANYVSKAEEAFGDGKVDVSLGNQIGLGKLQDIKWEPGNLLVDLSISNADRARYDQMKQEMPIVIADKFHPADPSV